MSGTDKQPAALSPKLLEGRALKMRLAGGSLLFLTVGALLAPADGPQGLSAPEERAAPLLEEQVQQRVTEQPFRGVSGVADLVRAHVITIATPAEPTSAVWSDYTDAPRSATPAGFGVFVGDSLVLTHGAALSDQLTVTVSTTDGRRLDASVVAYDVPTGLTFLRVPDGSAAGATPAEASAEPGAIGAGVAHDGRDIVVPVFFAGLSGERYGMSGGAASFRPGLPIFDLDGALVAIAGEGTAQEAIAIAPAMARLRAQAAGPGLQASLGIALQEVPAVLRPRLGERGLLVARVVPGGPADTAGVAVGQVLRAVDGAELSGLDAMAALNASLKNGVATVLALDSGGRRATVEVSPRSTYEVASLARAARSATEAGVPVGAILPPADLAAAGIPEQALVLRIDGRRVTSRAQALREFRRARRPLSLHLYHDGAWFFAGVGGAR